MVPAPRSWFIGPVRVLRASRALSLVVALAVGALALFAAEYYADLSPSEYLLLPLGLGGSTYYLAHYDLSAWTQDAFVRGFLRNFAMISIALAVVPDDAPLADGLVTIVSVTSVVFFAVLTAVVDALDADAIDGDAAGDDEERVPPWRRAAWSENR